MSIFSIYFTAFVKNRRSQGDKTISLKQYRVGEIMQNHDMFQVHTTSGIPQTALEVQYVL
jgi:hypothetical protein